MFGPEIERAHAAAAVRHADRPPNAVERWIWPRLLARLALPPIRLVLHDGLELRNSPQQPVATLRIRSRDAMLKLLLNPDLHFGEAFGRGAVEIEGDLVGFLEAAFREAPDSGSGWWTRWRLNRNRNTPGNSRRNIHHHYDLGNDFYGLWLDREMLYTCAYYPDPAMALEAAQVAKMDLVCRKLQLQAGDRVVEAGCGWGALACHMARRYGARVRAFNISGEQIAFARRRAQALGIADRVEFIEDDYRNITGPCDAFASVGMLEHVGPEHYAELGGVIDRCLTAHGRGLIHTIGRHRTLPFNSWIASRIFPGAHPPTLRQILDVFEPWDFCATDLENLRPHYARTLADWLRRYDAAFDRVVQRFDAEFARSWRLYLAGSQAAFLSGCLQLFQIVFRRAGDNSVPWTRDHMMLQTAPETRPCSDATP